MTASPRSLAWSPISGSLDQVFKCEKPGQHISPHQAAGRSKDQHLLGHLRTHCADYFGTNSELASGATACCTITGLPPPFTSGTAFQAVSV